MMFLKTRPFRSNRYLAHVRRFPCLATGCEAPPPSEAHHWNPSQTAMGRKCGDEYTLPLCRRCHRHFHDTGTLPRLDRQETELCFVNAQRHLLAAYVRETGA